VRTRSPPTIERRLGLGDAVSIVVGIVVGTAIFRAPPMVFQNTTGAAPALAVWLLGGVLCFIGALCYAELATTYPRNGGDYEYLRRAFGAPAGVLFGWAQLTVVLTGSIGAMAYAFADYGARLWGLPHGAVAWLAAAAIVALSGVNLAGVVAGKRVQNVLTAAKVLGLLGVVVAAMFAGRADALAPGRPDAAPAGSGLGLALVFVLYAFGGWSNAVFVTAEVKRPRRNLPRALLLGIAGITVIYLAVNAAYLSVLGLDAARRTATPAADVLDRALGAGGARAISVLVMLSALGAAHGTILTGSRVYATLGEDHAAFRWLGRWNRRAAPAVAIVAQAVVALLLVFAVGTDRGRAVLDGSVSALGLSAIPWDRYFGGFEALVAGSAPVFWAFFLLTGVAQVVLRRRDRGRIRPFSTPWYPLPTLVFCATCLAMLAASLEYARWLTLLGLVPLALGAPLALLPTIPGRQK